ncbi:phytanoyl-CoA dioxygenase family protein [Pedobacter frigoris]|uniref:phytanoyl-CoA dioxygenase family protein n=1 Tax=Pedobacter frigoris TaxID=2571272 RepID=UPI00292D0F2D|nr:phytanoyl-CoA dioxygenase family protein [Pedobacter frigoris]
MNVNKAQIETEGFTTISNVFTSEQIQQFCEIIEHANGSGETFRRSADLFAIRQFLKEVPEIGPLIFIDAFKDLIAQLFGKDYFVVKSIYFDKPEQSNWFVSYHQDLTISVDRRLELDGYTNWTVRQGQFAVQPPLNILESSFTVRIHLDDTDEENGALKVVPGSHRKEVYRAEDINWEKEMEVVCAVPKGGIMIMKPLLLHSSSRTTNNNRRRVIHIEFCNQELLGNLAWSERINSKEIH